MDERIKLIIETLASEKGVAPEELSPPLNEAVGPDALVRLLESGSVRVRFAYDQYMVTVTSSGDVTVRPRVKDQLHATQ